jgi:signal transduction histidine kinase
MPPGTIHEYSSQQIEREVMQREHMQSRVPLERNAVLYDIAPLGYLTLARNGTILDVNLAAAMMLGVKRALLTGECLAKFVAGEDYQVFNVFQERIFSQSEPGYCQVKLQNADKENLGANQPDSSQSDNYNGLIVRMDGVVSDDGKECWLVLSDISRQIEIEQENARLQENLDQARKMEAFGRLAGGIAHDFNNMLAVILGHTEIALDQVLPDQPFYNDLKAIFKAASHSADLTRQLLAFARKQCITPKNLDLNSIVEVMLSILKRLIGEDIKLDWIPGSHDSRVMIDPSQIDQILINLCVNARDAITGAGRIIIETGRCHLDKEDCVNGHSGMLPGNYVTLSVSDNGCGIEKKDLPHIYEPFFTTKEQGKGTGLGLSTVYGIVRQNNGYIECRCLPGSETTFRIYFPQYEESGTSVQN